MRSTLVSFVIWFGACHAASSEDAVPLHSPVAVAAVSPRLPALPRELPEAPEAEEDITDHDDVPDVDDRCPDEPDELDLENDDGCPELDHEDGDPIVIENHDAVKRSDV